MRKIRGIVVVCLMAFILVACDRNTEQKKDSWVVTQYGDQSGKQGMFYTIYNEKKSNSEFQRTPCYTVPPHKANKFF